MKRDVRVFEEVVQSFIRKKETMVYRVAVLLLVSSEYGTDPAKLATLTGLPHEFIVQVGSLLEEAQIWIGKEVAFDSPWRSMISSAVELRRDALVGLGKAERSWCRATKSWEYRALAVN